LTNFYLGLSRGPIDHQSSSVINVVSNDAIDMGAAIWLVAQPASELLPRATPTTVITQIGYGIAVGGDTDGIYGDGSASSDDTTRATAGAGQGVVVVTQGRCPAKVTGSISLNDRLAVSTTGTLQLAVATQQVIAIALQTTGGVGDHIIAVDVQRQEVL
jgi:hypothetical protein